MSDSKTEAKQTLHSSSSSSSRLELVLDSPDEEQIQIDGENHKSSIITLTCESECCVSTSLYMSEDGLIPFQPKDTSV